MTWKKPKRYYCRFCNKPHTSAYMADICYQLDVKLAEKEALKKKKAVEAESIGISLEELKEYFCTHYPHIDCDITDVNLVKWMQQGYVKALSITRMADLLADHLLANGAYAQE